jgi:hypothetical protein
MDRLAAVDRKIQRLRGVEAEQSGPAFRRRRDAEDAAGPSSAAALSSALDDTAVHPWSAPCWLLAEDVFASIDEVASAASAHAARPSAPAAASAQQLAKARAALRKERAELDHLEGRLRLVVQECAAAVRARMAAAAPSWGDLRAWHLVAELRALAHQLELSAAVDASGGGGATAVVLADACDGPLLRVLVDASGAPSAVELLGVLLPGGGADAAQAAARAAEHWRRLLSERKLATLRDLLRTAVSQARLLRRAAAAGGRPVAELAAALGRMAAGARRRVADVVPGVCSFEMAGMDPPLLVSLGAVPSRGIVPLLARWNADARGAFDVAADDAGGGWASASVQYAVLLHEPALFHRAALDTLVQCVASGAMPARAADAAVAAAAAGPLSPVNLPPPSAHAPDAGPTVRLVRLDDSALLGSAVGGNGGGSSGGVGARRPAADAAAAGAVTAAAAGLASIFAGVDLFPVGETALVVSVKQEARAPRFRIATIPFGDPRLLPAILELVHAAAVAERMHDSLFRRDRVLASEERLHRAVLVTATVQYGQRIAFAAAHRGAARHMVVELREGGRTMDVQLPDSSASAATIASAVEHFRATLDLCALLTTVGIGELLVE